MEFYLPATTGEWLAWSSAAVTALAGLVMLFAPGITMKLLRLQPINGRPEGYGSIRATLAGPYLGWGLAVSFLPSHFSGSCSVPCGVLPCSVVSSR
ncbi:hypothetical protein BR10RB9215_C11447 [Brucella sp. 10RB9215]|nr:hypothetical protein BR10RB9215_C11447 [Brucella sp. 10RB9215]